MTDDHDHDAEASAAEPVDVLVVGAGTAGETLAQRLEGTGRTVVVVTDGLVGGECPFTGCMPSKVMLHASAVGTPWDEAVARRDEVVEHLDDAGHAENLLGTGATLLRGRARLVDVRTVEVVPADLPAGASRDHGEVVTAPRVLAARDVVVATGSRPVMPPVEGLDGVDAWTSDDLYTAAERPASLVVLGGGAIGSEAAQAMVGLGVDVTVVERSHRLLDDEDPAVGDLLAEQLRAAGVTVHVDTEARAVRASDDGVVVTCSNGVEVAAERLLVAVGRAPNRDGLGLDAVDVATARLGEVDDQLRVPGTDWLWAVGDVNGLAPYTHGDNAQADVVARVLAGDETARYRAVDSPRSIYTRPPVLAVGVTAGEARDRAYHRTVLGYDAIARPVTDHTDPGVAVLLTDDDGIVRGFAGCGHAVDEWGAVMVLAVQLDLHVRELGRLQAAFPTHAELVPALARAASA